MRTTLCVLAALFFTMGIMGCSQSNPAPTPQGPAAPIEGAATEHAEGGAPAPGE